MVALGRYFGSLRPRVIDSLAQVGLVGFGLRVEVMTNQEYSEPQNDSSRGTGLLTFPGRLGRELEISKPIFRGPEGTPGVPIAPSNISLETESASKGGGSLKTQRKQGQKRETPVDHSHGHGR